MNDHYQILQQNKKFSIINGAFSMVANSYTGFLYLYAIHVLKVNHEQIGLLNSLPAIVSLFTTIIGGYWFSQLQMKKRFCGMSILFTRSFLLLLALIPFIPTYQAWILVILVGLMNVPGSLANLSWQSFIGDLIPENERNHFFSHRNRILMIVSMFSTALIGGILNLFDKASPYPYQVVFVFAFIFGVLETVYLFKHIEVDQNITADTQHHRFLDTMKEMIHEKPFLFFLLSSMLFNFGWQMAWPLFNIYQIEFAHATAFWLSLFTIANQLSQIFSFNWWGKMADRYGNSMMLIVAAVGMATAPFLTVLSTNLVYLTLINFFTGIFLAGTTFLLFNQLLAVSPVKNRSSYITQYTIFIGFIGFIAPQIGVKLLSEVGMYSTMYISSAIRVLGGIAFYFAIVRIRKLVKKGVIV